MGAPRLQTIVKKGNEVQMTYRTGENQLKTDIYNLDEFNKMFAFMKNLKLNEGDNVVENSEAFDQALEVRNVLETFRKTTIAQIEDRMKMIEKDRKALVELFEKSNETKNSSVDGLQRRFEVQLEKMTSLMDKVRSAEESALQVILGKEELFQQVVKDLEKKSTITWETVRDNEKEVEKSQTELNIFYDKVDKQIADFEKTFDQTLKDINNLKRSVQDELSKGIEENRKLVEEMIKRHDKLVEEKKAQLAREEEIKLKQDYIDREMERRSSVEEKKREHVRKKASKLVKKIKDRMEQSHLEIGDEVVWIEKQIESFQNVVKDKPEYIYNTIEEMKETVGTFKDKIKKAEEEKKMKEIAVVDQVQQKIASRSIWKAILSIFKK